MAARPLSFGTVVAALGVALLVAGVGEAATAAPARVAALTDVRVDSPVAGDVVVLGGDVVLAPGAEVDGDVVVLLGRVELDPAARVSGRVLALTSLASLQVESPVGVDPELVDGAVRVLSSGGWLLVTTAIAFVHPGRLRATAPLVRAGAGRTALLGVAAWLILFTALVAVLGLGPGFGPPLAATLMLAFFAVKAVGLTALGAVLGQLLLARSRARRWPLTFAVFVGVATLLAVRMVPVAGGAMWTVASVVALGAGVMVLAANGATAAATSNLVARGA
jgi:hypothetical protein